MIKNLRLMQAGSQMESWLVYAETIDKSAEMGLLVHLCRNPDPGGELPSYANG